MFIDKKIEAQRGKVTGLRAYKKWQSQLKSRVKSKSHALIKSYVCKIY